MIFCQNLLGVYSYDSWVFLFVILSIFDIRVSSFSSDFTGARCCSAVNWLMFNRALLLGVGFVGFCFSLAAQQTSQTAESGSDTAAPEQSRDIAAFDPALALSLYRPGIIGAAASSALLPDPSVLTRLEGDDLLAEMGIAPLDLFPIVSSDISAEPKVSAAPVHRSARNDSGTDGKDSPAEMVNVPWSPIYYGGEMGVFYGRWNGKYGGDIVETYIRGDVGNERFHISAGAAYGESNVNVPRFRSSTGPR
jgi:hypothetical protein